MADQKIIEYIQAARAKGETDQKIAMDLKRAGWMDAMIYECFGLASVGVIQMPIENLEEKIAETKKRVTSQPTEEHNSPFSVFMALVLIVSLFILSNKIFSDIAPLTGNNITSLLILQAFFVVPFLLTAFLLHGSLKNEGERYTILSFPYFLVSGWLLLRLLIKVGSHILDTNAALGIYIVLAMVIVVLTGIVVFVNRYIKK